MIKCPTEDKEYLVDKDGVIRSVKNLSLPLTGFGVWGLGLRFG